MAIKDSDPKITFEAVLHDLARFHFCDVMSTDFVLQRLPSGGADQLVLTPTMLRTRGLESDWSAALSQLNAHPLDEVISSFRRELAETLQAIGDPAIHAAGELITDQLRAIREAFLKQRRALRALEDVVPVDHRTDLMVALGSAVHAVGQSIARKAPGDAELRDALRRLAEVIERCTP